MNKYDYYDFLPHLVKTNMKIEEANEIIKINNKLIKNVFDLDCSRIKSIDDELMDDIKQNRILMNLVNRLDNIMMQTGWKSFFAKMHRSPKDSYYGESDSDTDETWLNYLEVKSGIELVLRFVKSLRIADDLKDYMTLALPLIIYIMPWNKPNLQSEFRFFIKDGKYKAVSGIPGYNNNIDQNRLQEIGNDFMMMFGLKFADCAIDCEVCSEGYRIIEINPLDYETDLYNLSTADIF